MARTPSRSPDDVEQPQRSMDELRRALEEANRQRLAVIAQKKSYDEDCNGRIKECDLEIASILQQLQG